MKPNNHKTHIAILFLLFSMQCSCLLGQNVIQLHRKDGKKKDYLVKINRHVKIKTNDLRDIKGKIIAISDSTITLSKKDTTNVLLKNIHYFYCDRNNIGNIITGVCFAALDVDAIFWSIYFCSFEGVVFGLITSVVIVPVPTVGTCYFLLHKKRYDLKTKYDLKIVKAQ
jgi:hypothetical protein